MENIGEAGKLVSAWLYTMNSNPGPKSHFVIYINLNR